MVREFQVEVDEPLVRFVVVAESVQVDVGSLVQGALGGAEHSSVDPSPRELNLLSGLLELLQQRPGQHITPVRQLGIGGSSEDSLRDGRSDVLVSIYF